jgi:signal transduction histidine kinase
LDDLEFATRAVAQGAQDFLVKSDLNGTLLLRSINYAIERKKTQERLESYAAELESSNEQLKGFAHTVAHEVKSPLTVVSFCLQVLEQHYRDQLSAEHWQFVEDAGAAIRGLTSMVNGLLEFSRMGSDRPSFEDIDMEAVFYHAYVCLRPAIKETGAVVTHDPLPTVRGNGVQLRQLLLNLIGNAIKYCSDKAPEVDVSAEESDEHWTFRVRDNGLGITPDDQQRIFEAFVRVHDQPQIEGSGIGLALCQRIVTNHGGRIWVKSEPGKGSSFCFTLPKDP